jgi:hypothetical protein
MSIALDFIASAMSKINMLAAGETPYAEDIDVGLKRLNSLMESFQSENLFEYTRTRTVATLPPATASRTIGPGQQINMARPIKIMRGSFSRIAGIDYPLDPISEEEYNDIFLKDSPSYVAPCYCFLDGGIPTGILYFWPVAGASAELHLLSPAGGGKALTAQTVFDLPPGYGRMIENNLAIEIAPDFNTVPSQLIVQLAASSKRMLKRTNAQIPQLDMDTFGRNTLRQSDLYSLP